MNIFEFYANTSKHQELRDLLTLGAQQHPAGLAANFLEKDIWVTEILRLLYDEGLVGNYDIAFKGGTALSKCWKAIERFSEDIDLSIHWADLAEAGDEQAAWEKSIQSRSQQGKFRKKQTERLEVWTLGLVERLNSRFASYNIEGLTAELEPDSNGEKVDIHFPRVTKNDNRYQLDHVLLEFGGRNRGRPTTKHDINCYLTEVDALSTITFPTATVEAFDPAYILWEKLTALHQFSTQEKEPNPNRLARHWYDTDCLLRNGIADPLTSAQAMSDVVEMKRQRWAQKGVNYEAIFNGKLQLIPAKDRLDTIAADHHKAIDGGMFFSTPDDFDSIIKRLKTVQSSINNNNHALDSNWINNNVRWVYSGAWGQAIATLDGYTFRSEFSLREDPEKALKSLNQKIAVTIQHKFPNHPSVSE